MCFANSSATTRLNSSRDDLFVERIDLEADFVGRMGEVDLAGPRVEQLDLLVCAGT